MSEDLPTYFEGDVGLDVLVRNGDIVVGMDGDFNSVWWKKGDALLNQRVLALRERQSSGIIARFAFYQIPISLKIANDLTPWSTVKHLASGDVLDLRLPAPELWSNLGDAA
jgi:type I restriction enzyme S subunit